MGMLRGIGLVLPWTFMLWSCQRPLDTQAALRVLETDPLARQVRPFALAALVEDVQLSPDGTYLAARVIQDDRAVLVVVRLGDQRLVNTIGFQAPERVGPYVWASDNRVVIQVVAQKGSLTRPVYYGELYSMDVTENHGRLVFGARSGEQQTGSHIKKAARSYAWADIIDGLPEDPKHILIASRPYSPDKEIDPTLFELDVQRGTQKSLGLSPVANATFVTDPDGEIRFAIGTDERGEDAVFYRSAQAKGWQAIETLAGFTKKTTPLRMCDRHHVIVEDNSRADVPGVYSIDLTTGEQRKIFQHPQVEATGLVMDPTNCEILALEFDPDYPAYHFLDPEHPLARMLRGLSAKLEGAQVKVVGQTRDGKRALVFSFSDRDPGQYFLVDVPRQTAQHVYSRLQGELPAQLSEMQPFRLSTQDGLTLTGYLTLPVGAPAHGLPMVVVPHGGPHSARDYWGFDSVVQMLASQGYAVLQVNFRGSGGFGEAFERAGYGEWGGKVQQDIIAATRWAIAQGFAAGDRVCIFGSSFGGYSALQSAILAPDLFRCAVGYAGIYDLTRMFTTGDIQDRKAGRVYLEKVLGPDKAKLEQVSPAYHADKIRIPIMLVHGEQDQRAPIEHAIAMRDALRARGVECEWLAKPDEGHGFSATPNRIEFFARLVRFLNKHTQPNPRPKRAH